MKSLSPRSTLSPAGTATSHATGFFVRHTAGFPYLVTNRHVVTGRDQQTGKELSDTKGTPSALRVSVLVAGRATALYVIGFPVGFDSPRDFDPDRLRP